MGLFNLPPFIPDHRGNKLQSFKIRDYKDKPGNILMLCGPEEVAGQLQAIGGAACVAKELTDKGKEKWTHALYFEDGVPQDIAALAGRLEQWLSIPNSPSLNLCMSVDWFKQPDGNGELVVTDMGRRINYTKYAKYPNGSGSRQARGELYDAMTDFVNSHPVYATTRIVTSPPGSKGDGNSFGERLGREIARRTGKTFVETTGPARAEQKEEVGRDVRDDFEFSTAVGERVLIVDDVFHTGVTLESTARAVRRAGATEVIALTAARTLRK